MLSNKIRRRFFARRNTEDKLIVDFPGTQKSPFNIESEASYNTCLSNGSLMLGLKKSNCIAWAEIPQLEFHDHVIEAKIRMDSLGTYISTGIIFRIIDQDSYYLALVSNKGYFRLDVVKNSTPRTLIAWTDIPDFNGTDISLNIITYGTHLIFIVNEKWLGEINDHNFTYGKFGFALASYIESGSDTEGSDTETEEDDVQNEEYVCKAMLDYISIDSRSRMVENWYKKWNHQSNINAESHLRLAETFAVMNDHAKALDQIKKAWRRRDEAISNVTISYTEVRTRKELLLAARMSFILEQFSEAEKYTDSILDQWPDSAEGKLAHTEKLRILNELKKYEELKNFAVTNPFKFNKDIDYYTLLARCYRELKDYSDSADAWINAFEINNENGVYAVNAANAYELSGNATDAIAYYIIAARLFLNQDNMHELDALIPKLTVLGEKNWEARALAGKWAFSNEDYEKCEMEFDEAEKLRKNKKPRPKADPALYYLWGLVNYINGKTKAAIRLLEKAVKLAPDYELFRTKLAELKKR